MDDPILFIHGFGGFAGIWRWQKEYSSVKAPCLAIDLPGHGVRPWNGESLEAMARMAGEECETRGMTSVNIVASSFGGLVAIKLCEIYPDLAKRIVFAGALPRFTASEDFPAGLDGEKIRKLAGQFQGELKTVLEMFFRSVFTPKERESEQYARIRELRREAPLPQKEALLAVLNMLEKEDLRVQLRQLNKPCLLMLGDSDPICPLPVVEA